MEQARITTDQLRVEASIQRKKVSEVAKEYAKRRRAKRPFFSTLIFAV